MVKACFSGPQWGRVEEVMKERKGNFLQEAGTQSEDWEAERHQAYEKKSGKPLKEEDREMLEAVISQQSWQVNQTKPNQTLNSNKNQKSFFWGPLKCESWLLVIVQLTGISWFQGVTTFTYLLFTYIFWNTWIFTILSLAYAGLAHLALSKVEAF